MLVVGVDVVVGVVVDAVVVYVSKVPDVLSGGVEGASVMLVPAVVVLGVDSVELSVLADVLDTAVSVVDVVVPGGLAVGAGVV